MDISVNTTEQPAPPDATAAAFAAGAATVIATDARDDAVAAADAAQSAAISADSAARAAERVEDRALDAQMTAESVDARLTEFVEEFRDFRDDVIDIMNEAASAAGNDLGLPPLEDAPGENDGGDQGDKPASTSKPAKPKHYLDRWFGGR